MKRIYIAIGASVNVNDDVTPEQIKDALMTTTPAYMFIPNDDGDFITRQDKPGEDTFDLEFEHCEIVNLKDYADSFFKRTNQ